MIAALLRHQNNVDFLRLGDKDDEVKNRITRRMHEMSRADYNNRPFCWNYIHNCNEHDSSDIGTNATFVCDQAI